MEDNKENKNNSEGSSKGGSVLDSQKNIQLTKNRNASSSSSSSTQFPNGVPGGLSASSLNLGSVHQVNSAVAASAYTDIIPTNINEKNLSFKIQYRDSKINKIGGHDLLDANKYTSQVNYGSSDSAGGAAGHSSSFNYHVFDNGGSISNEKSKPITRNDIENILWSDINNKLINFSKDLAKSKKSINESKRNISKIIISVTQQTEKIDAFDTTLTEAENRVKNKVKDFESEIITARNSLLGVIALFASFFTFISISVNIFSRDMSLSTSVSVLLVIWSCLISFIFIFMAGISKGGVFFTSAAFIKHAIFMIVLFISSFILPKVFFSILSIT